MNRAPRRLLPPVSREELSFIIDLSEHLTYFFEQTLTFLGRDGLEGELTQTSDMDLIVLAQETIFAILWKDIDSHGICHADIAALKRQGEIRAILYPEMSNRFTYRPIPSHTENYHMGVFEDQIGAMLAKFFGSPRRDAAVDVLLWRVMTGLVLDIAHAVSALATQTGVSDMAMMNYDFGTTKPLGARVEYVYLMKLHTRSSHRY